jgi:hypothetical protein
MNKDDFQDDPDYADFVTPTYDAMKMMKMMKYLPPRFHTLMISRRNMMMTHMTNMLELM